MYCLNVSNEINQIIAVFKISRAWEVEHGTVYSKQVKFYHLLFFASFVLALGAGAVNNDNREESIYLATVGIAAVVHAVRLFYFIWRSTEIIAFIDQVGPILIENHQEFSEVNNKVKSLMKFAKLYVMIFTITTALAFVACALGEQNRLPISIGFILDWKNDEFGYWVAFAYLAVQIIYSIVIVGATIVTWYIMLIFAIKYELLGNQFSRIGIIKTTETRVKRKKTSQSEKQNLFHQDLITATKTHQNIRKAVNDFKSCFSNLFFIQISTSSMGICGSIYALAFSSHQSLFRTSMYVIISIYLTFDIYMIMYFGNMIKSSSDRLSYCLFASNWMDQNRACRKYTIILTELIKQPQELVIGVVFPMDLMTFTTMLNLAYRMFNVLQNFK